MLSKEVVYFCSRQWYSVQWSWCSTSQCTEVSSLIDDYPLLENADHLSCLLLSNLWY